MKSTLTLSFAFVVSFLLMALAAMGDPDVNGIQGLMSSGIIFVVFFLALFPFAVIVIILLVSRAFGTKVGLITLLLSACAFSYFLMEMTRSDLSLSQQLAILARSTPFVVGIFAIAGLPHWLVFIRKRELNKSDRSPAV
ncbi:hypothetical protein MJD09_24900 [bacterium]|nr:hypothetical protein [bacterium]